MEQLLQGLKNVGFCWTQKGFRSSLLLQAKALDQVSEMGKLGIVCASCEI